MEDQDKVLLFEVEDDSTIPYMVPGESWKQACGCLSGEGAETQLVNALRALGIESYTKMGEDDASD